VPALESRLVGARVDGDLGALVAADDLAPLAPIDDVRGSAAYRIDATRTLLCRALREVGR
jgi:CO/xanthine dehydrogenase FAD-binding subunit